MRSLHIGSWNSAVRCPVQAPVVCGWGGPQRSSCPASLGFALDMYIPVFSHDLRHTSVQISGAPFCTALALWCACSPAVGTALICGGFLTLLGFLPRLPSAQCLWAENGGDDHHGHPPWSSSSRCSWSWMLVWFLFLSWGLFSLGTCYCFSLCKFTNFLLHFLCSLAWELLKDGCRLPGLIFCVSSSSDSQFVLHSSWDILPVLSCYGLLSPFPPSLHQDFCPGALCEPITSLYSVELDMSSSSSKRSIAPGTLSIMAVFLPASWLLLCADPHMLGALRAGVSLFTPGLSHHLHCFKVYVHVNKYKSVFLALFISPHFYSFLMPLKTNSHKLLPYCLIRSSPLKALWAFHS